MPPVGLLPDANLLATMVDGAVLVVRANSTPYHQVMRAIDALDRDRLLGVVLNSAATERFVAQLLLLLSRRPDADARQSVTGAMRLTIRSLTLVVFETVLIVAAVAAAGTSGSATGRG